MAFHKLDIDKLKTAAERWAKDIKKDLEVSISKITLYDYRLNIDIQSKMGNVSDNLHINLPRYAMIFEILCPGGVEDYPRSCPYKAIDDFVFRFTNYMAAARVDIPAFAVNDIKESYKSTIPENYQAEWEFLPHCTTPGCGGIEISAAVRTDEPFAVLYDTANLAIPGQKNTIPEQLKPCSFHALDIPFLRSIASRWGNDYHEEGVLIDRITLHPMGMPPSLKEVLHNPVKDHKYAVMFHCPECTSENLSIQDTAADILDKISGDGFSPYLSLFSATQERCSVSSLFYESFENVYLNKPPDDWQKEWRFVFLYSGAVVGCDVWQDTGIELYKAGITFRTKEDHQTANPITDIKNERLPEKEASHPLNADFQRAIDECCEDVGIFWNFLKRKAKNQHGAIDSVEGKALYDLAKDVYQEHEIVFQKLKIEDIDKKDFYETNTNRKRAIIGNVLHQVVSRKCPSALPSRYINTSIENLHNLFIKKQPFKSR